MSHVLDQLNSIQRFHVQRMISSAIQIIIYLRVNKASALMYDCSHENIKYASPHFGHGQENSSKRCVAYINVPFMGEIFNLKFKN